ncbi:hypothetical protein ASA1KI_28400 [Opitutales bacterium ASA1]|uniref:LacI family DNA-binding transcriptional regulator n=1 Tax=Congregicoccus parvus TaxID=3081749 RepID=UPI002B2C792D|nr:hypothetical protein ASA1KI_28400 [Opitutales bacterium ASA1]
MAAPTVRSLAQSLGLSRSTVSEALRDSPRIRPETAARVREAAERLGYKINPLASTMMSELRRSRAGIFRGVLATIVMDEEARPKHARVFFKELVTGARERATGLGFSLETFHVGDHALEQPRLDDILQARGIRGALLLPVWDDPDFTGMDWSHYAGIYTDYSIQHPGLHAVCCDHYRTMTSALKALHARGYRRPGLFLDMHQDERLDHRWEGAFLAFQHNTPGLEHVPPLVKDKIDATSFTRWFEEHRPDVVLGHHPEAIDWMKKSGAKLPETHAFACLNLAAADRPCAGLDLRPRLIGARAVELLIGQIQRNEVGIPKTPSLTCIPGSWTDGPTVRPR